MIAHNIQAGNTRPFEGTSGTDVSSFECGQCQIGIVSLIGQSTRAVASSLGFGGANGGFNNLYQIGGPHSIQPRLNSVPDMRLHDSKAKNTIRRPKLA
jgi:hypothetical protein